MAKILVAEDDLQMAGAIEDWLAREKYTVEVLHSGREAAEFLTTYKYDVIVLDWDLPEATGIEVCRGFRASGGKTPILILTGKSAVHEKTEGLDSGADDYLTKPFDLHELSARIRALLRRSPQVTENILQIGDIVLNPSDHTVAKAGAPVKIFPQEFSLLEFLMRNKEQIFDAQALLDHVWSAEAGVGPETVRQSIHRIRQQLDVEGQPSIIENVRGVGYRIKTK